MPATQANRMQLLAESALLFAEAVTDLPRLLNVVATRFSDLVGDATNIRLIEGDALVPVATVHPDPEVQRALRELHDQTPLRVGQGISGEVLATGTPYFEPELDLGQLQQRIAPQFFHIFEKIGITGMIVVRLRARGVNLGYLAMFRTRWDRGPYSKDDLFLVQDLADRAALAIDNSRLVEDLERRVTERTKALELTNRELEAFAHTVTHDLRSPLRAITGYASALEEDHGAALDADALRMLAGIRRNADRMAKLIEDLLRLARLGERAIQPVVELDMRALVEDVIADLRTAHPAPPIDLRLGELPPARGNRDLIRQVWFNLLHNAVKYSRKREAAVIEVAGARAAGEVRYSVTDHGAGFDPSDTDRLFGEFQRLHSDAEFEGTGVGLALVHRVVTRHGGRVWAEGRLGAGATFGFALPA